MSAEREFNIGRDGLFRIPHLPAEPDKIEPGDFLSFFREAWLLNGKSVGDVEQGTQEPRQEELIVPPTAEKPVTVRLRYAYSHRPSFYSGGQRNWREEYEISKTSTDDLSFVPELRFFYEAFKARTDQNGHTYTNELAVGQDSYTKTADSSWLVSCEESGDMFMELEPDHHEHLGRLATDFIELVSA